MSKSFCHVEPPVLGLLPHTYLEPSLRVGAADEAIYAVLMVWIASLRSQ